MNIITQKNKKLSLICDKKYIFNEFDKNIAKYQKKTKYR